MLCQLGKFDVLGVAEGMIDRRLGRVSVLRLTVHSESENWAILSEVKIYVKLKIVMVIVKITLCLCEKMYFLIRFM